MKRNKEKILIIGGCGYIGSSLFLFLRNKEYSVSTVDAEWFGNYVNSRNIKKNYSRLEKKFLNTFDVVILLAGHANYYMCQRNMKEAFRNNVINFVNLLGKLSDQKFIYASSSSVYESAKMKTVTEESDRYTPASFYDLTKKQIDEYAQLSTVNFYGLRLGTLSGFSPNLRVDLIINRMYHNARKNKSIEIHNPSIVRPVLGIDDLCSVVLKIIQDKNSQRGIYNIASFNLSVKKIAQRVSEKIGKVKIIYNHSFPRYPSFYMSTKKFESNFKFSFDNTVESIVDGLEKSYDDGVKTIRK